MRYYKVMRRDYKKYIRRNIIGKRQGMLLKAGGITALAFLLAQLLSSPFSASVTSLFSTPEKTDFILSDFYAQVADRRPVREVSDKIVMVDIGHHDREDIVELLEVVRMCEPAAIGVDINFAEPHEDDNRLLNFIATTPNAVYPLGLNAADNSHKEFEVTDYPFFIDSLKDVRFGASNLPGKFARSSIREFPVSFKIKDGDEMPSFVAAVAEVADSERFDELKTRGLDVEPIDYVSMEIPVMSYEDVFSNPEPLIGKVVMVGAVDEASDMHATPVAHSMAGLNIHSHALSTVLTGRYYRQLPRYVDYIVACLLCYLVVLISIGMTYKVKGLILRVLQITLAYLSVRIGYALYVDYRIIANFSTTFLMVAFGPFAIDVWNGSIGLREFLHDRVYKPVKDVLGKKGRRQGKV